MNYFKLLSCSVLALALAAGTADAARRPAKESPTVAGGYKGKPERNRGLRKMRQARHARMERVRNARKASKAKRSINDKDARLKRTPRPTTKSQKK